MKERDIVERLDAGHERITVLIAYTGAGEYKEMLIAIKDIFKDCSDEIKYLRRKLEEQPK